MVLCEMICSGWDSEIIVVYADEMFKWCSKRPTGTPYSSWYMQLKSLTTRKLEMKRFICT